MTDEEKKFGQEEPGYSGGTYARVNKDVDGVNRVVSKEGFVIDEKSEIRLSKPDPAPRENPKSETNPNFQNPNVQNTTTPPSQTPPPPKPTSPPNTPPPLKSGLPKWLKTLILFILFLLILSTLYIFFLYKSTLEISVSVPDARITLDNQSAAAGINKIKPGRYNLKIEKVGWVAYDKEVEVRYFRKTTLSIVLKETPKIISLYSGEANYLAYNKENDLYLFYQPPESAFFRLPADKINDKNFTPLLTSPHYIKNLVDVIWNPDRLTAVLKIKNDNALLAETPFYNPSIPAGAIMTYLYDFGRYDLLHQEAKFWATGIGDLKFTPKGDQAAYFFEPGTGEKSLVIANKDNSASNRILDLRDFINPVLSWSPDLKNIALVNHSTDYPANKVYNFNLIDKTLTPLTSSGNNLGAIFDPTGGQIIFSTYSSDPDFSATSLLSLMDKNGQNQKELKIRSGVSGLTFNSQNELLALAESGKNKYLPLSIDLSNLSKTEYAFLGEIKAPTSIEYLGLKNSIIFIDENRAKLLFLTTKDYE